MIRAAWEDRSWVGAAVAAGLVTGASMWLAPWLAMLVIVGIIVVVVGMIRPVALVPVVFASVLYTNAGLFETTTVVVPLTLGKLVTGGALLLWIAHAFTYRKQLFRMTPYTVPLLAVLAVMVISLSWATQIRWQHGLFEIIGIAMLTVMLHWMYTVLEPEHLPTMLRLFAAILVAIMAWTVWTAPQMSLEALSEFERVHGAHSNANYWCAILLMTCPLLIGFFASDDHWTSTPFLAAIALLLPLNVALSLSRSGFIALVAISPFLAHLLWHRKTSLVAGLILLALLFPAMVNLETLTTRYATLVDADLSAMDGSLTERAIAAKAAIDLFLDHPLLGVGVGMYKPAAIAATSGAMTIQTPHDTYLWIASEQGLLGLAVHGWLFTRISRGARDSIRDARSPMMVAVAKGYATGLLSVAIMAFTAGFMSFSYVYIILALGLVIGVAAKAEAPAEPPEAAMAA